MLEIKIQSVEGWLCCGETSDPIYNLDFEAKRKSTSQAEIGCCMMKSSFGDSALDMIITICRAFSRLKKKKNLLPEKGPTRVARDAAIVHPPFWHRLQKNRFSLFFSVNKYI